MTDSEGATSAGRAHPGPPATSAVKVSLIGRRACREISIRTRLVMKIRARLRWPAAAGLRRRARPPPAGRSGRHCHCDSGPVSGSHDARPTGGTAVNRISAQADLLARRLQLSSITGEGPPGPARRRGSGSDSLSHGHGGPGGRATVTERVGPRRGDGESASNARHRGHGLTVTVPGVTGRFRLVTRKLEL